MHKVSKCERYFTNILGIIVVKNKRNDNVTVNEGTNV